MAQPDCDIAYNRRTGKHNAKGTRMIAAGIRVVAVMDNMLMLAPLNSARGTGGIRIALPIEHVPELVRLLNWHVAGPLGRAAIEADLTE
jgi:hypothetical protein